jgi:hypothetical protein
MGEAEEASSLPAPAASVNRTTKASLRLLQLGALVLWFAFNASVVLGNKAVYNYGFNYPFSLTCLHMLVSSVGGFVCIRFFAMGSYRAFEATPSKFLILGFVLLLLPLLLLLCCADC